MSRIKLNFRRLTIPEKIAKAQQIVTALTGNASFPTPSPALAAVTGSIDGLNKSYAEAQAARQEAKAKTSQQNKDEDSLDQIISQLAAYVESVAGDDETLIQSAGMDTKSASAPSALPGLPPALSATAGDQGGEIDLAWDTVDNARSYVIEQSADPPTATSWAHAGVATKSRATMSHLTSGTRYWFRVAAVGTAGQGGWSDPTTKIAP